MRPQLIGSLVLGSLIIATPGWAQSLPRTQRVYVPVLETLTGQVDTEIRLNNTAPFDNPYTTAFLPADSDNTVGPEGRVPRALAAGQKVGFTARAAGLVEFAASADVEVDAWLKGLDLAGEPYSVRLPVITPAHRFEVEEIARLDNLALDKRSSVAELAVANLGETTALCKVSLLGRRGETLDSTTVDVPALALRQLPGAQGIDAKRARSLVVSCDQPYYPFALVAHGKGLVSTVLPANREACKGIDAVRDPESPGRQAYRIDGLFFTSTEAKPKGIVCVKVDTEIRVAKLVWDLDVTVGPWNAKLKSGAHNVNWMHRGRFRSDTLANVNIFGPGKNFVKANQNLDLPRGFNTKVQGGFVPGQGKTYHFRYVYDADKKQITMTVIHGNEIVKTLTFQGTSSRKMVIPVNGLTAELGHWKGQHAPEVWHKGWKFSNFRVEMFFDPE